MLTCARLNSVAKTPKKKPHDVVKPCDGAKHVFGDFPPLPPPKWSSFHSIESLKDFGRSTMTDLERLKGHWRRLGDRYPSLTASDFAAAKEFESSLDKIWWPLIETTYLRRITWDRAAEAAPAVLKLTLAMQQFMRSGSHFISCAERLKESISGHPSAESVDTDLIDTILAELIQSVGEYRCIWEELVTLEAISSHWSNETKMNWQDDRFLQHPQSLQIVVKGLFFWSMAVDQQQQKNELRRNEMCESLGLPRASFAQSWYQFGNSNSTHLVAGVAGMYLSIRLN